MEASCQSRACLNIYCRLKCMWLRGDEHVFKNPNWRINQSINIAPDSSSGLCYSGRECTFQTCIDLNVHL